MVVMAYVLISYCVVYSSRIQYLIEMAYQSGPVESMQVLTLNVITTGRFVARVLVEIVQVFNIYYLYSRSRWNWIDRWFNEC